MVIVVAAVVITKIVIPGENYASASRLLENGKYSEAYEAFQSLGDYKDSAQQILRCKYAIADALSREGWRSQAAFLFRTLGNYEDAPRRAQTLYAHTIEIGHHHSVGVKPDGTLVTAGSNTHGECDVHDWSKIVAVSANEYATVGLRSDGTVAATEAVKHGSDFSDWTDIVQVSTSSYHTVGLKADGTVVAVGENKHGEAIIGEWGQIKME